MRVVIAEDSVLLQAGLAKILAASGIEVAAAAEHQPDAVIKLGLSAADGDRRVLAVL